MAEAYRVLADTAIPRALRLVSEDEIAGKQYETEGVSYAAGDVLLAEDITPPLREQAENGDLESLLEPISRSEYDEAKNLAGDPQYGVFIPEHEAESVAMREYGHQTVPRDQVLELLSAGADAARETLEAGKEDGADERPALTEPERPSLVEVSNDTSGGVNNVPAESEPVDVEVIEAHGVEMPPGIPVGSVKEAAEGGSAEPKQRKAARRTRKQKDAQETVQPQGGQE